MRISTPSFAALAAVVLLFPAFPAHAVSKEMIQLQTQVQQLQDAMQHLQQTNDERMGVLQHLVEQTADSVNKMSVTVGDLQKKIDRETEGSGQKLDGVSGQIQSLNDSVDELKSRIGRMEKTLQDMQSQAASAGATPNAAGITAPVVCRRILPPRQPLPLPHCSSSTRGDCATTTRRNTISPYLSSAT